MSKTKTYSLTPGLLRLLRDRFRFRLIALLSLVFFIQQISFASLQNSFGFAQNPSYSIHPIYTEKAPVQHHEQIDLFVEAETAEEDEVQHNDDLPLGNFGRVCSCNELYYTSFINIRYLSLAKSIHHKAEPPYFILYHNWKSDLS